MGECLFSRRNPKSEEEDQALTYLHPSHKTPPKVLPTTEVSQWPYLSWKPPQGAESSGSKGVRGQGSEGDIWSYFPCPQGLWGGPVVSLIKSVDVVSRP